MAPKPITNLTVNAGDLIAVYGLLRAGQSGFEKFGLEQAFEFVGPCLITGQIFDMGGFPGLFAGEGVIIGDIYRVKHVSVIAQLDEFEDFWPQDRQKCRYERRLTALTRPENTLAWLYHCLLPNNECKYIADGDWAKWFEQNHS